MIARLVAFFLLLAMARGENRTMEFGVDADPATFADGAALFQTQFVDIQTINGVTVRIQIQIQIGVTTPDEGPMPTPMPMATSAPFVMTPAPVAMTPAPITPTPTPTPVTDSPTRAPVTPTPAPVLMTPAPTEIPTRTPVMPTLAPVQSTGILQGNTFPAINGQTSNLRPQGSTDGDQRSLRRNLQLSDPMDVVCGAVQSVLAHPQDPNICFAGATNGGVWRTTSCTAPIPDWKPLTDGEESLSVGDMVFDQTDENVVVVAVGRRSSLAQAGGIGLGLLYSSNALAEDPTWSVLDNAAGLVNFRDQDVQFNAVFVRGNLILASAYLAEPFTCNNIGIWRSINRGQTFDLVLSGLSRLIAADPNDPNRFYAVLDFSGVCGSSSQVNGIFTSSDAGATWAVTGDTSPFDNIFESELNNAKVSVSRDGSRVWTALLRDGRDATISWSDNHGDTWTIMDKIQIPINGNPTDGLNPREKPGGQGSIHFSLLANPNNRNEVYVGGDRQSLEVFGRPNFVGATDFTGALFRGDASIPATGEVPSPQWEHMTNSDDISEIPKGGTASGSAPHADSRDMELRADGAILEADDGGITIRTRPSTNEGDWFGVCGNMQVFETHSVAYAPLLRTVVFGNQDTGTIMGSLGNSGTFQSISIADGSNVMIDFTSEANMLYIYHGTQTFGIFYRTVFRGSSFISQTQLSLPVISNFVGLSAMNPADQTEFIIAADNGNLVYTSNRGETFSFIFTPFSSLEAMEFTPSGSTLYVSSTTQAGRCLTRQLCSFVSPFNVGGTFSVRDIAIDLRDEDVVYVIGRRNEFGRSLFGCRVIKSTNGGNSWTEITVPGSPVDEALLGAAGAFIFGNGYAGIAVGTSSGVFVPLGPVDGVGWRLLAEGLPTVAIFEMVYEPTDDTLVVATLGRGVWYLNNASLVATGMADSSFHENNGGSVARHDILSKSAKEGQNEAALIAEDAPMTNKDGKPIK